MNSTDRTFFVYLVVENSATSSAVPPGAFVTARIQGRRFDDVYVLPRTAFVGEQVFVVAGGRARATRPRIRFALPHVLLADAGLDEGAEVIVSNLEEVSDGTRITPVRADPRAEDS